MSKVGYNQFEYKLTGSGDVNVVFINGFRTKLDSWEQVYPVISKTNKVLLFNRYGVGKSSKATQEQTGEIVVGEIHNFFSKLKMQPPFLFVAHSLGGIFANLYARTYPDEISGVVFVDAPHPLEISEQKKHKPPYILLAINEGIKSIEKLFDKLKYSEDECIEDTVHQIQKAGPFPNIPLAVVSGAKKMPFVPKKAFDVHLYYQSELLKLSDRSKHYLCNESGHFPQVTEPEILISAIIDTANETKSS